MKLSTLILASTLVAFVSPALDVTPVIAASALSVIDADHDGTIDLNEARAAASALFDKLDVDHEGTLDRKELKGRLSRRDWKKADPDNDGTLTKDEYLAFVEYVFKRTDTDHDGTVDAKELRSTNGRALLRLLR